MANLVFFLFNISQSTLRFPAVCSSSCICHPGSTDSGHTMRVPRGPSAAGSVGGASASAASRSASAAAGRRRQQGERLPPPVSLLRQLGRGGAAGPGQEVELRVVFQRRNRDAQASWPGADTARGCCTACAGPGACLDAGWALAAWCAAPGRLPPVPSKPRPTPPTPAAGAPGAQRRGAAGALQRVAVHRPLGRRGARAVLGGGDPRPAVGPGGRAPGRRAGGPARRQPGQRCARSHRLAAHAGPGRPHARAGWAWRGRAARHAWPSAAGAAQRPTSSREPSLPPPPPPPRAQPSSCGPGPAPSS